MAHIRQKFGFGPVGRFGFLARLFTGEFGKSAHCDIAERINVGNTFAREVCRPRQIGHRRCINNQFHRKRGSISACAFYLQRLNFGLRNSAEPLIAFEKFRAQLLGVGNMIGD